MARPMESVSSIVKEPAIENGDISHASQSGTVALHQASKCDTMDILTEAFPYDVDVSLQTGAIDDARIGVSAV